MRARVKARPQREEPAAYGSTVVILDAGPQSRAAQVPPRALDWILHAFDAVLDADCYLVAGAPPASPPRAQLSVLSASPGSAGGWLDAVLAAPLRADRECYITPADLVFRSRLIELLAMTGGDVVAVSRGAAQAAGARGRGADGALAGLARLSPRAVACLLELRAQAEGRGEARLADATLAELLRELTARGLEVREVESDGDWARLEAPQDLARFVLGTKAESLERLRPLVTRCHIGAQVCCSVSEWQRAPGAVLARVRARFSSRPLAVRSSARREEGGPTSRAGHCSTLLDVAPVPAALTRAIDEVVASYGGGGDGGGGGGEGGEADHQVLIQEMVDAVALSGVVHTRTPAQGMPYYTIHYDDTGAPSGGVTGGADRELRTAVIHRSAAAGPAPEIDPRLRPLLCAVRELEELVGHDALDIELALDREGRVHLLQLRPFAAADAAVRISDDALEAALARAGADLEHARARGPGIVGRRVGFGVVPDWNPAEILGPCPRRLALGLYQHLITDEVWAVQRAECGYRDARPNPLLITIAGHPYIDIRTSFNSFVPACLDDELAERLVDHYLQRLQRHPHLHDKVELEVAFTCLAFDFAQRARDQLRPAGFAPWEIARLEDGLRRITRTILRRYPEDLRSIEQLEARYTALAKGRRDPLERALALLEDCRRYAALPFAHLARGASVATALLRSATAAGLLDLEERAAFLRSLATVAKDFERDSGRVAAGRLAWTTFLARYRHLRPGTYEVTSPSYGEEPERYLRPATVRAAGARAHRRQPGAARFGWSRTARRELVQGLRGLGLPDSVAGLEDFLRATIEGREWSQFVFTRNLSQALDDLAAFTRRHGCDREHLSHVDLPSLLQLRPGMPSAEVSAFLAARAEEGMRAHRVARCAQLPPLLSEPQHLYAFERFRSQPSFVTSKRVVAPLVELGPARRVGGDALDLAGRLVLVPQGDPGYDWLFGYPLAGLITMYGSAHSHLAVRAAEASLPAAIGVGEACYERLARAHVLEMDCAGQQIRQVQ